VQPYRVMLPVALRNSTPRGEQAAGLSGQRHTTYGAKPTNQIGLV